MRRDESHPFTVIAERPNGTRLEQPTPPDRVCRRARLYSRLLPPDAVISVRVNCPLLTRPVHETADRGESP